MTINDLKKVYFGQVVVTVRGYFKSGEYYSFYTYTVEDEWKILIGAVDEYTANLEIKRMCCYIDGTLAIDVVSIIDEPDEDES